MVYIEKPRLLISWKQKGNRVYFDYKGTEIYFIMPDDFKLSEVHPDLLKIAEWLMFSPFYNVLARWVPSRKSKGSKIGLSFSTGVDSVANMILLPKDTELVYTERDGIEDGILNQDNAFRCINFVEKNGRKVYRIKTNFELIRTFHNKALGYSTALGMGVTLVLMADYLGLKKISYGKVFDDQFFPKGVFRDYTHDYMLRERLFKSVGLELIFPTVGCSEVITTKIVDDSEYKNYAFSCLRGSGGKQCNRCYKCFRKNLLRGKDAFLDEESEHSISKNPPKMATSLMYALNYNRVSLPLTKKFETQDVSMLSKIYSPAYDIYDKKTKSMILNWLIERGFKKMSKKEKEGLRNLNFLR